MLHSSHRAECFLYLYTATAVCRSTWCSGLAPALVTRLSGPLHYPRAPSLSVICYKPEPETRVLSCPNPKLGFRERPPGLESLHQTMSLYRNYGLFPLWYFRSQKRKFPVGNIHSWVLSFLRTFTSGTKMNVNFISIVFFCSRQHSFLRELSLLYDSVGLTTAVKLLTWSRHNNKSKCRPDMACALVENRRRW